MQPYRLPIIWWRENRRCLKITTISNLQFFGTFLQKIKIERDPSRIPLVPVAFNIDIGMDDQVSFNNLNYSISNNKRASETFELFLNVTNCKEGYEFQWSYNRQLYHSSTIQG